MTGPLTWIGLVLCVWFATVLLAAAAGWLANSPVPPPAIAFLLTGAALLWLWTSRSAREHVRSLGPGPLVAFHLTRLVAGAYFLVLYRQGLLPREFAVVAGWGDIIVAIGAMVVLWICLPIHTNAQRQGLLLWNTLGLIDILLVLGNGVRLFTRDPGLGAAFTRLPLALLPTFVVPIVITSHLLLFAWYWRADTRSAPIR
jgi:hypothetical protein